VYKDDQRKYNNSTVPKIYQFHPAFVHFPIALLLLGWATNFLSFFLKKKEWLPEAASWLLWLGTLAAWLAVGLGLLAERTAPHVPTAWEVLYEHENLGYWTAGIFSTLSLWRFFSPSRFRKIFMVAWTLACSVLLAAAQHGGKLVFDFGMGLTPQ